MSRKANPRTDWRINSDQGALSGIGFDEVVVGKWIHLERMDTQRWYLRLGDREADIYVSSKGVCDVQWREP